MIEEGKEEDKGQVFMIRMGSESIQCWVRLFIRVL